MRSDLASLLPCIYDCATASERWEEAIDGLVGKIGSKSALIAAYHDRLLPFQLSMASELFREHAPALAGYQKTFFHYEQEAAEFISRGEPQKLYRDVDLWPDLDQVRHRPDYVYCREKIGIFRKAGVRLNKSQAWFHVALVQFDAGIEIMPEESLAMLGEYVPHLAKALELNRFFSTLTQNHNAVLSVLDRVKVGIAVLNSDGCVVTRNDEAQRIFELNDGISLCHDKRLICRDENLSRHVDRAIEAAAHTACGKASRCETLLAVRRHSGRRPILLEVIPLRDGRGEIEQGFAGAMVSIIDPDRQRLFNVGAIGKAYGLSRAEQDVCKLMVEGLLVSDIADTRNVTLDTVKTQIKNIYSKIDASSRTELIRLILSACPPIEVD